jgi:hypothetical protein
MSQLRLVAAEDDASTPGGPVTPRDQGQGPVPFSIAQRLKAGEAVVWWGSVDGMRWRAPAVLAAIGAGVFLLVGIAVPELWQQPPRELLRAFAVCVAPGAAQALRNWLGRRAVVVTDTAILDEDPNGRGDRLGIGNIRCIRRDWSTGGVLVEGAAHRVKIPPSLVHETRAHVLRQRSVVIMRDEDALDDRLGWLR